VKKRRGKHERTIRELRLDGSIAVGEPLAKFQDVLSGTPVYKGASKTLMRPNND
jgi:circadian clock protein KaiC